jgi:hypothetical protein
MVELVETILVNDENDGSVGAMDWHLLPARCLCVGKTAKSR